VYSERLWPSAGVWLLVPVVAGAAFVALVPIGSAVGLVGALAVAVAAVGGAAVASPTIRVTTGRGGEMAAGKARIPVALLGRTTPARGEDARRERGPALDARAFLLIRGWVGPVLRVELDDPQDPTPYWLLSTRRPEALASAVERATTEAGGR
jgi:hypothetical protein